MLPAASPAPLTGSAALAMCPAATRDQRRANVALLLTGAAQPSASVPSPAIRIPLPAGILLLTTTAHSTTGRVLPGGAAPPAINARLHTAAAPLPATRIGCLMLLNRLQTSTTTSKAQHMAGAPHCAARPAHRGSLVINHGSNPIQASQPPIPAASAPMAAPTRQSIRRWNRLCSHRRAGARKSP